jgi:cyclohexanone monooxygenase
MTQEYDAVVVGAGFAGLCMLHRLRGLGLRTRVFEAGSGVGGTWFWNRYPGARCDVESLEYSYQFSEELEQEWEWTERYASQPEILRYLNHVADRFDLRRDIALETRVVSAVFDEADDRWRIRTDDGAESVARFCIMATGCLSSTNTPSFPGLDTFPGPKLHTGNWPHERVDFSGRRVGVIGTGSSGIQAIPIIAEEAAHLTVFQRTPNYSVPASNHPLDPARQRALKRGYRDLRQRAGQMPFGFDTRSTERSALEVTPEERLAEYEDRWRQGGLPFLGAFADMIFSTEANDTAADFIRGKIRALVRDPAVAETLAPRGVVGCKRLCSDTGYFETFNRSNVALVDIANDPIEAITAHGVRTRTAHYDLDSLVFATGFDAMTGALSRIDLRGRGGVTLRAKWAEGPRTYLGLSTAGFPNFFIITGPGSPSVLSNMVPSIEQHANWIANCIAYLGARGLHRIEATREAEDAWVAHVNEVADTTLYPSCNSWYLGANIPGKPRVFMPYLGFPAYVEKCNEVAARGYEGFVAGP